MEFHHVKEEVDDSFWEKLCDRDPEEVSRNGQVEYVRSKGEGFYKIPLWGKEYLIFPHKKMVISTYRIDSEIKMILLQYLLCAKDEPLSGKLVSEKDLRGGESFFRGNHAINTEGLKKRFGYDAKGFVDLGNNFSSKIENYGDASFTIKALPRIPITYVLWLGDSELPPFVKVLFDSSIERHLDLHVISHLVNQTTRTLLESVGER